ncbi:MULTISPECIES: efflux RND transporter periplasmic adaptor subunit [unclassified Rhizobium]|uniref:efflux RND transporter periplasmic adaptor subunit n=1 Tax=unclassified Rhizobium TaxID=2613769 RepID=UPI001160807B|nr:MULTISPECIES: efflux RND transporter periplasmic adaptor subunit [unclassified Rhizobium]QXZ81152.1 efflux RND transporter periplasmic adaptor subunit [Rhizobium sp. L51/94]TQX83376.1 efflux RND transporter periplasmic adaptor subunit [Rhizobium sp. rho-13.1]TQY06448.1 efflux RND transporter periplasmic adaptor subunit [Rhizobium sp. rho-1.1]
MLSRILACCATLCATGLTACSDDAAPPPRARTVMVVTVQSHLIGQAFSQTGEVQPRYQIPMSFRLEGKIVFRIENGTSVKAGDVLASVDKIPSSINVSSASAQVDVAKSDVGLAELTAARNWELFSKNAISRAQVQQGDANLHAANSKLEAANAALDSARQSLSYTDLRADRDGIVSGVSAGVGQVVTSGQTVMTLSSNAELDAVFDIPEQLWNENLNDPEIQIRLLSDPTKTATGKVREVTPSADAKTRTYRVRVTLQNPVQGFPMGAAVSGKVILSPTRLFEVPSSAMIRLGQDQAVFVYVPQSKTVHARAVKIERYAGRSMFVSDGLGDGDLVATAGVTKLRDGEAVTVEKDDRL